MGETLVVSGREDVELVRRFVRGDRSAFDSLVERYQVAIFRFLYRMVGDASRAEELAQETFLRVFRAAAGYKPQYRFSTWLYAIARNCARGEMKKNARAPRPAGERIEEEAVRSIFPPLGRAE